MSAPVVFDYLAWVAMFPELAEVTSSAAQGYFNLATMFIDNAGRCVFRDPSRQTNLLYLATAHVTKLLSPQTGGTPTTGGGEGPSPLVGRITAASEGSVSVAADMPGQSPSAAWWMQTTYGALVWQMLLPTRTGPRIAPNPRRRVYNPPIWLRRGGLGGW